MGTDCAAPAGNLMYGGPRRRCGLLTRMSKPSIAGEDPGGADVTSISDARDRRRLDELTRTHRTALLAVARKLCRGNFDADDLVQDVLVKAVDHFDRLPEGVNHIAWMTRVMHNLFIDQVRRRAARPTAPIDDAVMTTAVVAPAEAAWWEALSASDVRAALPRLPNELRAAFELFAFDGLTYKQISARLGVPIATVGTRVLRARRRLRIELGGPGREHDDE